MKDTPWDHGLRIAADADGLAGHAGDRMPSVTGTSAHSQLSPKRWRLSSDGRVDSGQDSV